MPVARRSRAKSGPKLKRGRKARNVTSRKGFSRTQAGGPAAHDEAVRNANQVVEIAVRQGRAWKLFVAGATFEQIGAQLGVSGKTAWYDCVAARDRMFAETGMDAALIRDRQHARLDDLYLSHVRTKSTKASAEVLLKISDREAKLFGLDAPVKAHISGPGGGPILHQHALADVPDDEVERRYREAMQVVRTHRSLPAPILDVAPEPASTPEAAAYAAELAKRNGNNGSNGNNGLNGNG